MKKIFFFVFISLIASCTVLPDSAEDMTKVEKQDIYEKDMAENAIEIKEVTEEKPPAQNEALEWVEKSYQSAINHQWAETIRTSSAAIAIDPNLTSAYINRAWAYTEKGLFSKAIEDCNKVLEIEPDNAAAFNNRGLAYSKLGAGEEALRNYRKACELGLDIACKNFKENTGYSPLEEVKYLIGKSIEELSAGNYELAINYSTKVLEIEENNEHALSIRCDAKANLGLLDEAEKDCLKAIKANPDSSISYNSYGFVLEKKSEEKQAVIYYEISCDLGSNLGCENNKRLLNK